MYDSSNRPYFDRFTTPLISYDVDFNNIVAVIGSASETYYPDCVAFVVEKIKRMAFKVSRVFFGGYTPNFSSLASAGWHVFPFAGKQFVNVLNSNQGFGAIDGGDTNIKYLKDNGVRIWG